MIEKKDTINPSDIILEEKLNLNDILNRRSSNFETEFSRALNIISFTSEVFYYSNYSKIKGKLVITNNIFYVILTDKEVSTSNPVLSKSYENVLNPLVSLNFNLISAKLIYSIEKQTFKIIVLGYKYNFNFSTKLPQETFKSLISTLQMSIITSKGYKENLLTVSLIPHFYQNYYITVSNFLRRAKTGDILIFRGFGCSANCQRCFTGSHYDHVALLLKRGGNLWVYESTSLDGCRARSWCEFTAFNWNLLYEKIIFRELIVKSGNKKELLKEIENKLEEFYLMTERKPYKLKACGFCCLLNSQKHEKDKNWKESTGFFCSQLLYASYCHANILKYQSDTRAFMPNNFSKDGDLPFNPGFELGPEYIIDFNS